MAKRGLKLVCSVGNGAYGSRDGSDCPTVRRCEHLMETNSLPHLVKKNFFFFAFGAALFAMGWSSHLAALFPFFASFV